MQQVIVKRLPTTELVQQSTERVEQVTVACVCVDDVFHTPNPDCERCLGEGVLDATDDSTEWITRTSGEKRVWVTSADIILDPPGGIADDEDGSDPSDIHAFFSPSEDVQPGDLVIPAGGSVTYTVKSVQQVRSLNNAVMLDCALKQSV